MSRIHLMRRGEPLPEGSAADPGLSPVGREHLERSALSIAGLGLWFDLVLCAPDAASVHSARAVLAVLNDSQCRVTTDRRFRAAASIETILAYLQEETARSLLIISDAPLLPRLASQLLCGENRSTPLVDIAIEHGGLLCLEVDPKLEHKARLLWSLPPLVLTALAPPRS